MTTLQSTLDGCLNTSEIPIDYLSEGGLVFLDPTNGWCYPVDPTTGQVQYYAQYGYNPALATGAIFSALFGLLMLLHFAFALKSKRKWLVVTSVGALGELIGWIGRALSGTDNSASVAAGNYFLIQIVCLTIAPVFFSATCYGIFTILVTKLNTNLSRFSPQKLTWTFVTFDIISLVLQAAGGGMTASANTNSAQTTGTNIFLAGIIFQLVVMVVFSIIAVDYFYRLLKETPEVLTKGYKMCTIGVAFASFTIILRGGYRTAELAGGWHGYLMRTEIFFLLLDAMIMVLCLVGLALSHPVFTLPRPSGKSKNATVDVDLSTLNEPQGSAPWYKFSRLSGVGSSRSSLNGQKEMRGVAV